MQGILLPIVMLNLNWGSFKCFVNGRVFTGECTELFCKAWSGPDFAFAFVYLYFCIRFCVLNNFARLLCYCGWLGPYFEFVFLYSCWCTTCWDWEPLRCTELFCKAIVFMQAWPSPAWGTYSTWAHYSCCSKELVVRKGQPRKWVRWAFIFIIMRMGYVDGVQKYFQFFLLWQLYGHPSPCYVRGKYSCISKFQL